MPIHRRLPKRGFTNIFKKQYAVINIYDLARFESDSIINEGELIRSGLIKGKRDGIKLLGNGELKHPLTIRVNKVSEAAVKKIEAAGGKVEVV